MRRPLLVLLALVPAGAAVSIPAPAAPATYPSGNVVYRPECFGNLVDLEGQLGAIGGAAYGGVATTAPSKPSPPPAAAPTPNRSGPKLSISLPTKSKSAPAAPAEAPPPPPPASYDLVQDESWADDAKMERESGDAFRAVAGGAEEAEKKPADKSLKEEPKADAPHPAEDRDLAAAPTKVVDWGGTIYLSNDDSMSLASAQRLLYAAMNHLSYSVSQIRPHELLNYFSFDAATPTADQLFDVLASAEQTGDHLSVALAVKGGMPPREDLDLTLVVDRSCSMTDEGKMDYTRRGLNLMSDQLRT